MTNALIRFIILIVLLSLLTLAFVQGVGVLLECEHTGAGSLTCHKTVQFLGLVPLAHETFENVIGARWDAYCPETTCTYRLILLTEEGEKPLTIGYEAFVNTKSAARINAFIVGEKGTTLRLRPVPLLIDWLGFWLALGLFALGLWLLYRPLLSGLKKND